MGNVITQKMLTPTSYWQININKKFAQYVSTRDICQGSLSAIVKQIYLAQY